MIVTSIILLRERQCLFNDKFHGGGSFLELLPPRHSPMANATPPQRKILPSYITEGNTRNDSMIPAKTERFAS